MHYEITAEPLDLGVLVAAVRGDEQGGLVTFVGYVRRTSDDGETVTGLSYEAHADLALAGLREVGRVAGVRFGDVRVAIAHRIGDLSIGEAAVAIAVAAPHRAAAFDACEFAIDELKRTVPIWKKEHYAFGDARWRENAEPAS